MKGPAAEAMTARRAHLKTFVAALMACAGVVLWMVGPYVLPLYLGGTLAMVTYPAYLAFRSRRWGPRVAAGVVVAVTLLVAIVPLATLSILAVTQGITIGRELVELKDLSPESLRGAVDRRPLIRRFVGDPGQLAQRVRGWLREAGHVAGAGVLRLAKGIPDFLIQLTLALIAFYFLLVDGEKAKDWALSLGALDRDVQEQLFGSVRESTLSAVMAGLAAAVSQSTLITAAFLLLDVPGAFLAGGLTFVFSWIPLVGTGPAILAAAGYLFAQGSEGKLVVMLGLGFLASVVDSVVRPIVLKGRAGMHPLVGFVAIVSGIRMFGILGVFIGPILAAMMLSLFRMWPAIRGDYET